MSRYEAFNFIDNPLIVCNSNADILFSNSAWKKIIGIDYKEGVNYRDVLKKFSPDKNSMPFLIHENIEEVLDNIVNPLMISFRNPDKKSVHYFKITISKGDPGIFILNHEECKTCLRSAMSRSEIEFLTLVNAVDDLIFTFTSDLKISGAYGKWFLKHDLPREGLSGYHLKDVLGEEAEIHSTMLEKALSGISVQYKWSIRIKNLKYYFYSTISPVLNEKGETISLVSISKDVTDLELIRRKAEQSDKLKTAILSGFSHEIRTPLNAILGFSQIIAEQEDLDDQTRKFADIVVKRSNDLVEIIENVMETALIKSGEIKVKAEKFSLNKMLDKVYGDIEKRQFFGKANIKLIRIKEVLGKNFYIDSDEKIIVQIFRHLLENSYKFTEEGIIEYGYQIEDNRLVFFVKDTGIGIETEKQKEIWELFIRGYDYDKSSIGGLGLGLTIVKSLIESLHGKVWCKSLSGKGTGMFFEIPFEDDFPNTSVIDIKNPCKHNDQFYWPGIKILLADRNEINVFILKEVLKQSGLELTAAKNFKEAYKVLTDSVDIRLFIVDLDLQDEDCRMMLSNIKKARPDLKVIMITSGNKNEHFPEPDQYDEVLFKPLIKDSLLNSLHSYLVKYANLSGKGTIIR